MKITSDIKQTLEDIREFREADLTDIGVCDRLIQTLKADKALMNEAYTLANREYMQAKDDFELCKAEEYKKARETMSQIDSTYECKFLSIPKSKLRNDWKCKRDKAELFVDDIKDMIWEVCARRKDLLNQTKYG